MDRDFKGVWIPKEIWLSKELSTLEKVLLTEISSLDNENHCTAGNDYFAEFFGCSERTISRAIAHLKDMGYIGEVSFDGRHRILSVDKMSIEGRQNVYAEQTICPPNNIYSNLDSNIDTTNTNVLVQPPTAVADNRSITPLIKSNGTVSKSTNKSGSKKKNLYEKCLDKIDEYTEDGEIKNLLQEYLKVRLERKDIPLGASSFEGILKKLSRLTGDRQEQIKIIQQAIDRKYPTFYPLIDKPYNSKRKDKFNEFGIVKSVPAQKEDIIDEAF